MKLKTSAIALAVAGAMGASMAAQAESGFYGSVRIGLVYTDQFGNDETQVKGVASRFGFRSETDLGNGLTGFGRYEFGVSTEGGSTLSRRHAYVGLKADWGKVTLGQTYQTYYNFMVGPLDNPWRGAAVGVSNGTSSLATWLSYTGRTAQAISYAGDFGGFSVGGTAYLDSSAVSASGQTDDVDGIELAVGFDAGPIRLALGFQDLGGDESVPFGTGFPSQTGYDPEPTIAITASGWETGIFTWGLSFAVQDGDSAIGTPDAEGIILDVLIGNGYFHYEQTEYSGSGVSITPTLMTLGYTQSLGRQTTAYYEVYQTDADTGVSNDDETSIAAVLKYDWK